MSCCDYCIIICYCFLAFLLAGPCGVCASEKSGGIGIENGSVDMLPGNVPDEAFKKNYLFSNAYFSFPDAIYASQMSQGQLILDDLAGDTEKIPRLATLTEKERAWLKKHQVIRVHNEKNWPPFNYYENGQPMGFSIDYMNLLAEKIGVEISYQTGPEWNDFLGMLQEKKLDVMLNIVRTEDRLKYILFTKPYIKNPNVIVSKTARVFTRIEELNGLTVAIPRGFFHGEILRKRYPEVKILDVADTLEALKAVNFGKADATLQEEAIVRYLIAQNMLSGLEISGELDVGNPDLPNLRIGVRDDWPIFQSILNKAIRSVSQSEILEIQQKWLALADAGLSRIDLTEEEQAWLAKHKSFQLGVDPMWPPIESLDEEGHYKGLAKAFLDILSERLGITFTPVKGLSWTGVILGIESGIIDVLAAATRTAGREEIADFTEPYITLPLMVFTKSDHPYITKMAELKNGMTAVVDEYAVVEFLERDWPDLELIKVKNVEAGLQAVASGRADHYIDTLMTTTYSIQRLGFANIKVAGETPYKYALCLAVQKRLPHLRNILRKAMASITEDERNSLFNQWRSIHYEHGFDYSLLWKVLAVVAVIMAIFIYWNRRLALEINERKKSEQRLVETERKTRAMSEAIHDGLVMIDDKARVMYWNHAAENLFDLSAQETMGKDMHSLFVPDKYQERARQGLKRFAKTGKGPVIGKLLELTAHRKDGTLFPVEVGVSGFQMGEKWYAVGTIRDITERIQSQEAVTKIRAELQQIFDNAQVGIQVLNSRGKIYRCNQKAAEIFGFESPGELIDMSIENVHLSRKRFEAFGEKIYSNLVKGEQVQAEYELKKKDGTAIWCSMVGKAMDDSIPPDMNKGIIWVIDDISEKRRAEKALKESEKRVKTILNSINTGIIIIDPENWTIVEVNPVAAGMIGLSQDEIIGRLYHNFICPKEEENCPIIDHRQQVDNAERVLLSADGREISILKTVVPVMLNGRRLLLESFVDLTHQKQAENDLQQNLNELERFYRMAINREEKMIDLKMEINHLLLQLGQQEKYTIR